MLSVESNELMQQLLTYKPSVLLKHKPMQMWINEPTFSLLTNLASQHEDAFP